VERLGTVGESGRKRGLHSARADPSLRSDALIAMLTAMPRATAQFLELAKRGAEHRYRELQEELAALVRHFPHLRGTVTTRRGRPARQLGGTVPGPAASASDASPKRGRRTMSAAARRAVSERMKKYWAARRKAKAG